jgi:hypothetical protein
MQIDLLSFTERVVRDMMWWMWRDDHKIINMVRTIGALNIEIPVQWSANERKGDFLDYVFNVEPYSFQHVSPASKVQTIRQLWSEFLMPGAPLMAQQGVAPDMHGMLRTLGKLMNLPEIEEIVTFTEPQAAPGNPQAENAGDPLRPTSTSREYVRRNVPTGGTPQSRTNTATQALMSGVQPKQGAAMSLPTAGA